MVGLMREVVRRMPSDRSAHLALADAYEEAGDAAEARLWRARSVYYAFAKEAMKLMGREGPLSCVRVLRGPDGALTFERVFSHIPDGWSRALTFLGCRKIIKVRMPGTYVGYKRWLRGRPDAYYVRKAFELADAVMAKDEVG